MPPSADAVDLSSLDGTALHAGLLVLTVEELLLSTKNAGAALRSNQVSSTKNAWKLNIDTLPIPVDTFSTILYQARRY